MSPPPADGVLVTDNRDLERYDVHVGKEPAGSVTYRLRPGRITFLHTEVDPAFEGRGVGGRVAAAVLDDARARGLSVVPACPFIAAWIRRHPAYQDLVQAWPPADRD